MARAPFVVTLFRQSYHARQSPNVQIRYLTVEPKDGSEEFKLNQNEELTPNISQCYADIVKQVCQITRTRPRWEQNLLSDFPSFNFSDPQFFREFLGQQQNVLLSLRFFYWLHDQYQFLPDSDSCSVLFDALVEAKACKAAKGFLDQTSFRPEAASLERYVRCLFEGGLIEEAIDVLNAFGFCPSITTWNSAMLACLKVRRTDLVWELYQDMIDSGAVADVDANTIGCLIQAFCNDGKVENGYELLQQVLEGGLLPANASFNKLIAGFCKTWNFARVSELLHTMIARNNTPDIYSYQEVINGLCKKKKQLEGYRVFSDLKNRGYTLDRVIYTTMIHGLCKMGWLGDARKLWFEMLDKRFLPNEYTYNALLHGFYKVNNPEEAEKLYKEMIGRGYGETTVSYNTVITGLCSCGRIDDAHHLFEEMPQKGILRDVITFNALIRGFSNQGKIVESTNLLKELLAQGLQPSTFSYTPVIEKLCQAGDLRQAKTLLNDMQSRGLEPRVSTREHIITGLCEQGCVVEGMECLMEMLQNKLRPKKKTFEKLVECLSQNDRLDDSLLIVDVMLRMGYDLRIDICHSLVTRLCQRNFNFVELCLEAILESN